MSTPTLKELCARAVPGPWRVGGTLPWVQTQNLDIIAKLHNGVSQNHETEMVTSQLIARIASPEVALAVYEALELADEPFSPYARRAFAVRRALELLDGKTTP